MNANELREQGNTFYASKKFHEAISSYSKAIQKNPDMPQLFTNRALCYLRTKSWERVVTDCRSALELNRKSVKAHFFLGQALIELKCFDEAIGSLYRANDLAREQKLNFGDDISQALRLAKKRRWNTIEDKRIKQEIELQSFLNNLIKEAEARQVETVLKAAGNSNGELPDVSQIQSEYEQRLKQLNHLFAVADERRMRREVPDYLCGKISFEIMREPVITPSGITYDRKDIEEHLQRVGHFDPVTRIPLSQDMLIPNLALKDVIDHFVEENPWCEDY